MELFICLKKFSRWAANQCFIAVGSELSQIYVIKRGLSFEKKKKKKKRESSEILRKLFYKKMSIHIVLFPSSLSYYCGYWFLVSLLCREFP